MSIDNDENPPIKPKSMITIPLGDYVGALIASKEYSTIGEETRAQIVKGANYFEICVIENDGDTETFQGCRLGELGKGLYRLWHRGYFDKIEAGRRTRLLRHQREIGVRAQMETGVANALFRAMSGMVKMDLCLDTAKKMSLESLSEACRVHGVVIITNESSAS